MEDREVLEMKITGLHAENDNLRAQIKEKNDVTDAQIKEIKARLDKLESGSPLPPMTRPDPGRTQQYSTNFTEAELNSLPWQPNKYGEWIFATQRDGSESADEVTRRLVSTLRQSDKGVTLFNRKYSLSGQGKFVGRK